MNNIGAGVLGVLLGAAGYWVVDNYAARDATSEPTAEEAKQFIADAEATFEELGPYAGHVYWIHSTFITYDSDKLAQKVSEDFTALGVKLAKEASRFNDVELDYDTRRKVDSLRGGLTIPSPSDPEKNAELAEISTDLGSTYGKGKYCRSEEDCLSDVDIIQIMATSHDEQELLDVWQG